MSKKKKILVVDQDPLFREMIEKYLSLRGLDVEAVNDVSEANHSDLTKSYDLIVTDYSLELREELEGTAKFMDPLPMIYLTHLDPIITMNGAPPCVQAHVGKNEVFHRLIPALNSVLKDETPH